MVDELKIDPALESGQDDGPSPDRLAQFELARKLLKEQSLVGAILAGTVAAIAGAIAWGALAHGIGASYSIFGIGVGVLVGWGVREFGRGIENLYPMIAIVLAIFGCIAGNFAVTVIDALAYGETIAELLASLTWEVFLGYLKYSLGFLDVLAWAVAAFCAGWLSKRHLDTEEALAVYAYRIHGPE